MSARLSRALGTVLVPLLETLRPHTSHVWLFFGADRLVLQAPNRYFCAEVSVAATAQEFYAPGERLGRHYCFPVTALVRRLADLNKLDRALQLHAGTLRDASPAGEPLVGEPVDRAPAPQTEAPTAVAPLSTTQDPNLLRLIACGGRDLCVRWTAHECTLTSEATDRTRVTHCRLARRPGPVPPAASADVRGLAVFLCARQRCSRASEARVGVTRSGRVFFEGGIGTNCGTLRVTLGPTLEN